MTTPSFKTLTLTVYICIYEKNINKRTLSVVKVDRVFDNSNTILFSQIMNWTQFVFATLEHHISEDGLTKTVNLLFLFIHFL